MAIVQVEHTNLGEVTLKCLTLQPFANQDPPSLLQQETNSRVILFPCHSINLPTGTIGI